MSVDSLPPALFATPLASSTAAPFRDAFPGCVLSKIKIEQKYTAKYAPIVLWWDDVTEIFEVLQENAKAVELETSTYKFTTLDIAKEHLGSAPQYDVKISASSPYVSLDGSSLYVGAGPAAAQVFMDIDKILKRRERKPRWLYSGYLVIPGIALGFVTLTPADVVIRNIVLFVQFGFTVLFFRSVYMTNKRAFVVYTQRKSEVPGFFQRNKDQLFMYIITAVLGGVLTFVGLQLKEKFFPTPTTSQR